MKSAGGCITCEDARLWGWRGHGGILYVIGRIAIMVARGGKSDEILACGADVRLGGSGRAEIRIAGWRSSGVHRQYLCGEGHSIQLSGDAADGAVAESQCDVSEYGVERGYGFRACAGGKRAEQGDRSAGGLCEGPAADGVVCRVWDERIV